MELTKIDTKILPIKENTVDVFISGKLSQMARNTTIELLKRDAIEQSFLDKLESDVKIKKMIMDCLKEALKLTPKQLETINEKMSEFEISQYTDYLLAVLQYLFEGTYEEYSKTREVANEEETDPKKEKE